jgi:hypothetical protein
MGRSHLSHLRSSGGASLNHHPLPALRSSTGRTSVANRLASSSGWRDRPVFELHRRIQSAVVTKPVPNFTRLDPGRPEIAILMDE